jgi:high-affinity iron transporter
MWSDFLPNLLIGLREGLEAGLIVSILVATLVRADRRDRIPLVWTGVLAAAALSISFGAVLTFAAASMSTAAQENFSGVASLIAVGFVTMMVFWMRTSARALSADIKGKVTVALALGPGVLVLTAFLAVAREGIETSLFLWTTTRGADESVGPLIGAAVGLALAATLCAAMYVRAVKVNLTRFFTYTGVGLIVIASGVAGYGLRDLQEGGALPGFRTAAFDVGATIDSSSWYARLVEGVFNITTRMTVLQVVGYLTYLLIVMTLFIRGTPAVRPPAAAAASDAGPPAADPPRLPDIATAGAASAGARSASGRRVPRWVFPVSLVVVPAVAAGAAILALGPTDETGATTIEVANGLCAAGWSAPRLGRQTFTVHNGGSKAAEVRLINPATDGIYAEIELLGPGTSRPVAASIGGGTYAWECLPDGGDRIVSASQRVSGAAGGATFRPVTEQDLAGPLRTYQAYVTAGLTTLQGSADTLRRDIEAGDLDAAKRDWLPAHLDYERLGAAYGTFGDFDSAINGRPAGRPGGVHDPDFTGFRRIEYGLYHGEPAASLVAPADKLSTDVAGLREEFPKQKFDPNDLALRSHEILENTLQFDLNGSADQGSGTELATTSANVDGTRELLTVLAPPLQTRAPGQLAAASSQLDGFGVLVKKIGQPGGDGTWVPLSSLSRSDHQQVNGSLGQLLETLAPIPDILEIRSTG